MTTTELEDPATEKLLSIDSITEGFYLASVLRGLFRAGVIQSIQSPTTVTALSEKFTLDKTYLKASLDYLVERSDLVIYDTEGYQLAVKLDYLNYFISQYLEAFGPAVLEMEKVLANPSVAESYINRHAHSQAFSDQTTVSISELPHIINQFGCQSLLELGCGTATLLIALAEENEEFIGYGIDSSSYMCTQAQKIIQEKGLSDRLTIFCDDVTQLNKLKAINYDEIQAVSMTSLMNELLYPDTKKAVNLLNKLRHLVPGRIVFIGDYYGRLGGTLESSSHGLLHDYVQLLSGQGIPPQNVQEWQSIYEQADCQLLHAFESSNEDQISYFIHLLKL